MRTKPVKTLPKPNALPGAVCVQWRRCGKPNCRCAAGSLHGPYFYRFWRQSGRLCKQYVKPSEAEAVRAACQMYRQQQAALRQQIRQSRQEFQELLRCLREFSGV